MTEETKAEPVLAAVEEKPAPAAQTPIPVEEKPVVESKPDSQIAPQWAKDRIAKLTARLRAAEQAKASGTAAPVSPETGQAFTQAQIDSLANERAQLIAQNQSFNDRCNDARSAGEAKFGDFSAKLSQLLGLVDGTDPNSARAYRQFLETALETGEAPKIIHMMGSDLNLASKVLSMSPIKMALEVAKMAQDKGAPEPSRAPKPIASVGSRSPTGSIKVDDPERATEIPISDWMKARAAQAKERGIR